MFIELFLKKKGKELFTNNAFHVMIKLQNNISSLPSIGSNVKIWLSVCFLFIFHYLNGKEVNYLLSLPLFLFLNKLES